MKIIHGDNQVKSRELLIEIIEKAKTKGLEILKFAGNELSLTELKQACESTSLWGNDRLIVIELGISKAGKEMIEYLANNQTGSIVIWEGAGLKVTDLKKFGKVEIKEFKLSTRLFEYLDLIGSKNGQGGKILDELLKTEDEDLVFIMTHKRLRQLVYLSGGGESVLNGVERMAPWQVGKLKRQAGNFQAEAWKDKYEKCLEFDWNRKMGRSGLSCAQFLSGVV